jgi:hypothetical protein
LLDTGQVEEAEYTERAKARIHEILGEQHAVVALELEARISEAGYADSGMNIDPHHITNALKALVRQGSVIRADPLTTRGGQAIETIQPADIRRRKTAVSQAAARKRLLYARYLGWATGTKRHPHGLIGPAGEQAVRSGILLSGGLQPVRPNAGEVTRLLNVDLPGPVDSAGYAVPLVNGVPGRPITVLVEVKNIRGWIYPSSEEIYQLLFKAVLLQERHPDQPILPVLVCRKAQTTSYWMAQQLGFMIIDMGVQFAGDVDDEAAMDEVRNELYFHDLRYGSGPSLRVRDRFQKTLPIHGAKIADAWRNTVHNPYIALSIRQLRYAKGRDRNELMAALRQYVKDAGHQGF